MPNPTRREILVETASCARHLALAAAFTPALARAAWARRTVGPVVAVEPFGRGDRGQRLGLDLHPTRRRLHHRVERRDHRG
jgi:hypothetical protein